MILDGSNSKSSATISKALLNPGDEFIAEIVSISRKTEDMVISGIGGRIADIKQIDFKAIFKKRKIQAPFWHALIAGFLSSLFVLIIAVLMKFFLERRFKNTTRYLKK